MKNKILIIVFAFLSSMIISCKKSDAEIEAEYLKNSIEKLKLDQNVKWIVILPGLGCHGCIQEGEVFMQNYIDNKNIVFVLTKIESLKILQKKTGVNLKEHSNIYIDRNAEFNVPTDNSIYPCIVEIKEGELESVGFQSPKNGVAFDKLKQHIL
ncbi:hypothetical protein [Flavobacterium sp. KACC 22761]|uniref:hypothetical protein n=1 Tax=Flavobacterium sp. KACC 22761 TaxID=3092665 RepID=UPI002A764228|nr:hypothetical protein [Flavobacterium sp. KACC 22761]WPO77897.1 hypothetical protein SCB73_16630 [Flavobacterium sp. KACC 22761]